MATTALEKNAAPAPEAGDIATFATSARWRTGMRTDVTARQFSIAVDEPAELGGADTAPNPMELLLAGLNGCMAVVIHTIAGEYGAKIRSVVFASKATLDTRGFLGTADVQAYFQSVRTRIEIGIDDISDADFAVFQRAVRNRCPAGSLIEAADVDFDIDWVRV